MALNLLLVEDDREDVVLIEGLLEEARTDFDVEWVGTASAARAALAGNGLDVCLIDQRLGEGATGLDVIGWARSQGLGTPMIVLTGYADGDLDLEGLEVGADGFIDKGEMTAALLERTVLYAIGPTAGSGPDLDELAIATDLAHGVGVEEVAHRHGLTVESLARLRNQPRFAELLTEIRARVTREAVENVARSLRG